MLVACEKPTALPLLFRAPLWRKHAKDIFAAEEFADECAHYSGALGNPADRNAPLGIYETSNAVSDL